MPSPFPGMDPYLEAPDIWPDFHERFAGEISVELNRVLPPQYYARLEMRPEVGLVGLGARRHIVPDASVARSGNRTAREPAAGTAVLAGPRSEISPFVEVVTPSEPLRHQTVEIRDVRHDHLLITLIEIASPANKRPGPDRRAYQAKQKEVLASDASLVEIDLLRGGEPVVGDEAVAQIVEQLPSRPDYLVSVNRAWHRGLTFGRQIFPIDMTHPLPCIPVPLREGEAEEPLDLQYVFNRAYDGGPYRRGALDYGGPVVPPLGAERAAWLKDMLSRQRAPS